MKPPPAIQVLLTNRKSKERDLRSRISERDRYQEYADHFAAGVVKLEADIADIDRAIEALSYPD